MVLDNQEKQPMTPTVLTVEQLNFQVKQLVEGQIGQVWVQGEISNFKAHTSGHFYFSLKDSKSQITAVMFRGFNSRLKFKPVDGTEVIVRGRLSVYEPRGNYQIVCEMMEPVGAGALQKAFEQLKAKLKAEGLFEVSKKRTIPKYPQHIAIVTSPTGAAIQDILNVLSRRIRNVQITVVPTVVQGAEAAPQICEAFKKAQKLPGVDVIIVGRGGGSIEDMWCFNDEVLARLVAASGVPVISAVGHEIDFTICDFVADLRAPTPSAAAELVAQSSEDAVLKIRNLDRLLQFAFGKNIKAIVQKLLFLKAKLVDPQRRLQDFMLKNDDLKNRLDFAMDRLFSERRFQTKLLSQRLISPIKMIEEKKLSLTNSQEKLLRAINILLERKSGGLQNAASVLDSLSPLRVVGRGYAIVTQNSCVIKDPHQVSKGDTIVVQLAAGQLQAKVI